ncbi:ASCH domain-containing protein [Clostridium botulinum]|uniref:ASCH domain-containing protein n=1 Tax=Clostridium botulinum TaxID=1491 RepID=UPI000691953C|nr:ASCH domain-containing protein [Clostridium botulinum]KOC47776.1 RNA-binding protein [Clostridium botulinum]NFO98807.1 ASCH domain-containing protein [Clostridium botulinum]OOV50746.1 RNA-binding protein [Clostridium botulinum D/C]OOV53405.1 RNA-binding protein [Clostridium botulinum D/C]OOV58524.1 RNA-binding protein [Clostridium botulinum D/C]
MVEIATEKIRGEEGIYLNAEEMWIEYKKTNNDIKVKGEYEAWKFGVDTDLLADLVVRGEKTATASAHTLYEIERESLPNVGKYNIILDSKDKAICIIQTTNVYVVKFKEVSKKHAFKEGEGDKTLSYWKKCHKDFFTICMTAIGKEFSEDMKVVCEEFKVVFKI